MTTSTGAKGEPDAEGQHNLIECVGTKKLRRRAKRAKGLAVPGAPEILALKRGFRRLCDGGCEAGRDDCADVSFDEAHESYEKQQATHPGNIRNWQAWLIKSALNAQRRKCRRCPLAERAKGAVELAEPAAHAGEVLDALTPEEEEILGKIKAATATAYADLIPRYRSVLAEHHVLGAKGRTLASEMDKSQAARDKVLDRARARWCQRWRARIGELMPDGLPALSRENLKLAQREYFAGGAYWAFLDGTYREVLLQLAGNPGYGEEGCTAEQAGELRERLYGELDKRGFPRAVVGAAKLGRRVR